MTPAIIPRPQQMEILEGAFRIDEQTAVFVSQNAEPVAHYLADLLRPATGFGLPVAAGETETTNTIQLTTDNAPDLLGNEGYQLDVAENGVVIRAQTGQVLFYVVQTLQQLLPVAIEQDEVREVVAYAQERFVTVVPGIEMLGHAQAALAAYPELGCTGGPYDVQTCWGIWPDVFCAGNEQVFAFLEDLLTEVFALFPSEFIHVGADECPKDRWEECLKCQAVIKREGLANIWTEYIPTTEHVEYMAYPREAAIAEAVWTAASNRDFDEFKERLPAHSRRLDALDVNYRPLG